MENKVDFLMKAEDYRNWDKLSEQCNTIEGLTTFEKEKCKRAFQFLKKELGEDFLDISLDTGHPFTWYIITSASWTRKWLIWFAEALKEVKKQENYSSLMERLKNKDKFPEALSILKPAYNFLREGFNIIFDPKVIIKKRSKVPDLKIINKENNEGLFVEVSILGKAKNHRDAFRTENEIFQPILKSTPFLYFSGKIHKILTEKHLQEIVKELHRIIDKAKSENAFQELIKEDVIEIAIAPESDKHVLEHWAKERGLKTGEVSGPSVDSNEIIRTKRKIEKEQKQLPPGHPNIIIIENYDLFFGDIKKVINEIEEEVYKYPHLLFAIIRGGYMGASEPMSFRKGQHTYIRKTSFNLLVDQYIIFFNRFCDYKVSASTITKIYTSFSNF